MPVSELVLITMALLTLAMLAAGISRSLPIPYTVFLVILGVILGAIARHWEPLSLLLDFQLTPDTVLFLFLPALIFESAFNLDGRQLLKDLAPVLTLAIPALLISTAIIGTGLWLILDLDFLLALLFGALISATDPVAVIALFKELGAPLRLTILVEGESLLNDATAIVVFNIILGILLAGVVNWSDFGIAIGDFIKVFIGGALAGILIGIVLSELLNRLKLGVSSYLILSIVLAYASFAIAEHHLHVSGVMAVVAGAITLGALGVSRISQSQTHVVKETWETIALVCNSLLFLLVGISVDPMQLLGRLDVILLAIVMVLIARAATVYSMVPLTVRLFKLPRVSLGERHIMWWGGLKGGLAIAIVMSIPDDVPGKDLLFDLTLGVVMFSLLINAPTIRPLIRALGIDRLTDDEKTELQHAFRNAETSADNELRRFQDSGLISARNREQIAVKNHQFFSTTSVQEAEGSGFKHHYIYALRMENEILKELYDIGLIPYYSYLDIRNNIQHDREYWIKNRDPLTDQGGETGKSLFLRFENSLLKQLREHDWAAKLLSRYQYLRFSQSLQRDMAGYLICHDVIDRYRQEAANDEDQKQGIIAIYERRLQRRRQRIDAIAREFPEYFSRFVNNLLERVSMNVAGSWAEEAFQHGEIGSKVFTRLQQRVNRALTQLTTSIPVPAKVRPGELIGKVPLFNGLPATILQRIANSASPVTFLTNDIVIGEGEHGNALYIIRHGHVVVYKESEPGHILAEFYDGDFFGEMALLGDQVRTATVKAAGPTTVLRLTRRDILVIEDMEPDLKLRLQKADEERRKAV